MKKRAEYVEDGSIVLRSGTVKTSRVEKCGNQTVRKNDQKIVIGNVSGQVVKMKMAVTPQKTRKQIMQNSFEQAKSHRHLTANVENKWFSDSHEKVNPATPNDNGIHYKWFNDLHKNVNSTNSVK